MNISWKKGSSKAAAHEYRLGEKASAKLTHMNLISCAHITERTCKYLSLIFCRFCSILLAWSLFAARISSFSLAWFCRHHHHQCLRQAVRLPPSSLCSTGPHSPLSHSAPSVPLVGPSAGIHESRASKHEFKLSIKSRLRVVHGPVLRSDCISSLTRTEDGRPASLSNESQCAWPGFVARKHSPPEAT